MFVRSSLSQRKLGPVKQLKKRTKRSVADSLAALERIKHNAALEAAEKAERESLTFFTS